MSHAVNTLCSCNHSRVRPVFCWPTVVQSPSDDGVAPIGGTTISLRRWCRALHCHGHHRRKVRPGGFSLGPVPVPKLSLLGRTRSCPHILHRWDQALPPTMASSITPSRSPSTESPSKSVVVLPPPRWDQALPPTMASSITPSRSPSMGNRSRRI